MNTFHFETCDETFTREVEGRSGQDVSQCYQCGNCTAGCPYTFAYDIPVSRIMRLVQTGQKAAVMKCRSIWLCATCQSCTTRCPNSIDVAGIMDHLRHMAREAGLATERQVKLFSDCFLDSIEKHGRVFELGLMAGYVTKTGRFWTDMEIAPKALLKKKMHFKPAPIQGKDKIAEIFKRFRETRKK